VIPRISKTLIAAAVVVAAAHGCDHGAERPSGSHAAGNGAAAAVGDSSSGEIVGSPGRGQSDSAPTGRWLSDANVLALLVIMNSRAITTAEQAVEGWHSDSVRAFALSLVRDHAGVQRSIDSLIERGNLGPVRPAVADRIMAAFQMQADSIAASREPGRSGSDRAFLAQQIASHALMVGYIRQLAGVAERPDLQALLSSVSTRVASDVGRTRAALARLSIDSTSAADSELRAARRLRDTTGR
jgi:predicted outer membrane protein